MLDYVIVIPARLKSSRLPNKPLIKICGREMILRTVDRCKLSIDENLIYILTDSKKLKKFLNDNNCKNVVLTSSKNKTGTDRIYEFSKHIKAKRYINVQGDEPIVNPKDILKIINASEKNKAIVYNGYSIVKNTNKVQNKNLPKVVFDKFKNLLYMSRSDIPSNFKAQKTFYLKQICIYSYPRNVLQKVFNSNRKTYLEKFEDIEILRFLESGVKVKMVKMSGKSMSVDVKKDIYKVERILKKKHE